MTSHFIKKVQYLLYPDFVSKNMRKKKERLLWLHFCFFFEEKGISRWKSLGEFENRESKAKGTRDNFSISSV